MKKAFGLSLLLVGASYCLFFIATWRLSDGFRIKKIQSDLTFNPKWEVKTPPLHSIQKILSQNFYYIGKGSQCYVFESEDKDFVLKFFRQTRYHLPKLAKRITEPTFLTDIQNTKLLAKQQKLDKLFSSCKIAFEQLQEESGLIYLHLNKTDNLHLSLTLFDTLKRPFTISLDQYEFVIQQRGIHLYPYLSHLIKKKKKEQTKAALSDLASLLACRLRKGIYDHDSVIHKNSGFRASKPLFLDIGSFSQGMPPKTLYPILKTEMSKLRDWLAKEDLELAYHLDCILNGYNCTE
ncbi:MAG: hypothetical protein S4CHLAM123_10250 [Chlamydiales bacterium]|nr:hypothetical protein [Chlamydiales bacterium]